MSRGGTRAREHGEHWSDTLEREGEAENSMATQFRQESELWAEDVALQGSTYVVHAKGTLLYEGDTGNENEDRASNRIGLT